MREILKNFSKVLSDDIDKQAQERFERLIEGMKQEQGEQRKAENQLEWVQKANHIRACARGYPLHFIKQVKHFSNGDNPEQVNNKIENFIIETVHQERKDYAVL